jgi:hypothetical protein
MIADIPHKKALKLVHPKRKKGQGYATQTNQGLSVLEALGFKVTRHFRSNTPALEVFLSMGSLTKKKLKNIKMFKSRKLSNIKKLALIRVRWRTGTKHSHVLIWDPVTQQVYDPGYSKSLPYAVYERNMTAYFELTPTR